MRRLLSHILLFALLVVSPFSFTTPEIPSIYISVTINNPVQESKKAGITVTHRVMQIVPFTAVSHPSANPVISLPTLPAFGINREIEHGRAPPVIHSV